MVHFHLKPIFVILKDMESGKDNPSEQKKYDFILTCNSCGIEYSTSVNDSRQKMPIQMLLLLPT